MFRLNLKIALRNLWKNKGYTLINVGGLAIGLASCMVLLLYVAYEWSYDKQFKNYDKTYVVYLNSVSSTDIVSYGVTPAPMAKEISEKIQGVAYASHSSTPTNELLSYKQNNFKKAAIFADPSFLKILDYKFIKGNPMKVLQETNSVILTQTMARNLFGDEDPINKTVKFQNSEPLKVEAVIEDVPKNSTIQFDYLMPWSLNEKLNIWVKNATWGSNAFLTLMQLKDNKYLDNVSGQIKGIYKRNWKNSENEGLMHPLSKWHLYDKFENGKSTGGKIDQIRIFIVLAFCILLIACVNFMNLSTARSEKRSREVGVRKAIGSSRKSLIGQFLMESMVLSLIGMLVAFTLIEISLPYFNNLLNIQLVINYQDWKFWSTLLGLTIITGFIAGSYPAFYLSSFEPVKVLKGFAAIGGSSLSVRRVLVVFQFVFAACLIVCTGVIYQQLNFIKNKPIGYDRNGLIEIPVQGNLKGKEKLDLVKDQLLKSGAATSVTYFSHSLNQFGDATFDFSWPGKNPKELILFNYRGTGYDFTETTGAKIIAGREFSSRFVDTVNVLVNETAVKIMGLKQPVGTIIKWDDTPVTIVGVMKDFVMESPYQKVNPLVMYNPTSNYNYIIARLNPDQNLSSSVSTIDNIIKKFNPDFPVDHRFVNDDFESKLQNEKLLGTLSNWFGGFAVFISCLGLLGLALFMAEQRKKEISIRKVLGASTANILTLLNKDFIKLVAIANLIAFPLAYIIISHWLSAYSFRVAISVLPFAIAVGLSFLIAILTVSIQSVKVAKSNPVDALKYE
ncbi:ABC transporter permease [Pedobacter panaciterrae]|jgi:ABC-type transport system, involved in lipoprotein release, permease component|uniref:ABC transporter permease n=1 Tax=Pedobacter panaciterrae TaxID=363849 RepID=A0ABU8NH56_9SPHI|nr:ABC transporter permease [Pedobacter panaciterrae]NQX53695.1 ABC transporter permease [Pedobacter panaciterrae]